MPQHINQTSGQSVQAKNVRTDEMFAASTMVQHILTELYGAATGNGRLLS
jgi:hypothetical protein